MKTIVKLVLGTAVLAAGASAANAAVPLPSTGSSDLLFFVSDTSNSTTYTEVLSQTVGNSAGSLFSSSDVSSAAVAPVQGTSVGTIDGKSNFSYAASTNTNLQSFISTAQAAGQNLVWGIYAGAYTGSTPSLRKVVGAELGISTAPDASSIVQAATATLENSALSVGLNGDIKTLNLGTLDAFGGTSNGVIATPQSSDPNPNFYAEGFTSASSIGSSVQLYGVTANGTTAGQLLGYDLGTITFNGSTLSFTGNTATSPVPLPAAAWLFGSGLLGLLGIGRRRNVAAAA
jgi:hypothetical protein